jgi:hypothetical protein
MAWRIDESVVRGEIDNRTRGRLTGRIWFVGRADPVVLDLQGNCWRDLAGRRLEFTNPEPKTAMLEGFHAMQNGLVGDITASRKVKVPEIPLDQIGEYYLAKKPFPWHWGNSLYLEWFSEHNGRVVVESAGFELKIIGEAEWAMTEKDEIEQRKANGVALTGFMGRQAEAMNDAKPELKVRPQTEAEAEAQQARSDQLLDRIEARLAREGEENYDRILEEEIDRQQRERGDPALTPEQEAERVEWMEEVNRAAEEALANPDPEMEVELDLEHPLVKRVSELSFAMRRAAEEGKWRPAAASQEHPVSELLDATMIAGPKLAGGLNGRPWPPGIEFCAHTIVRLKRAGGYLEDALRAADACREDRLIPGALLDDWVRELQDCAEETDVLIAELRAKLERGID